MTNRNDSILPVSQEEGSWLKERFREILEILLRCLKRWIPVFLKAQSTGGTTEEPCLDSRHGQEIFLFSMALWATSNTLYNG
jgi:hypothetical protein